MRICGVDFPEPLLNALRDGRLRYSPHLGLLIVASEELLQARQECAP